MARGKPTLQSVPFGLPVGGKNSRDPLELMRATDAIELINWVPNPNGLTTRRGSAVHQSGMGSGAVDHIAAYASAAGTKHLIAFTNNRIYNTTASPVELADSLTNTDFVTCMFRDRLIMVNGADAPRTWDGTTLATPSITGVTTTLLDHVSEYKTTLYFIQKNSAIVWYLPVNSFAGAATSFDFASLLTLGGKLIHTTQWTQRSDTGVDNQFVAFGENGDVLIYGGLAPDDASWAIVRKFVIPRPINKRSFARVGADIVVLTKQGIISLADHMQGRPAGTETKVSDKVNKRLISLLELYGSNPGWAISYYPSGPWLICNVPVVPASTSHQIVFNLLNGAAFEIQGWNARCFTTFDDQLYYGGLNGSVYEADSGTSDSGQPIKHKLQTAYQQPDDSGLDRQLLNMRPVINVDASVTIDYGTCADYQDESTSYEISVEAVGTDWYSEWYSEWTQIGQLFNEWVGLYGQGKALSIKLEGLVMNTQIKLDSLQIQYELGGVM